MITECPECQTTFRLTAQALRQAHGRVRCGSCGNAFNALDHLSEEPPAPNLSDTQTAQIFEDESRALLESLDDLAGDDDIRIEDTGAEWQVVDDELVDEPAGVAPDLARAADGAGSEPATEGTGNTRWTFVDAPHADSEQASEDAVRAEAEPEPEPETADDDAAAAAPPPQGALDLGHAHAGEAELRFDDNTPLPDEYFRPVTVPDAAPATPRRRASDRQEFSVTQPATDSPQVDLELDGDDWQELLAEVEGDEALAAAAAPEEFGSEEQDRAASVGEAEDGRDVADDTSAAAADADDIPDDRPDRDTAALREADDGADRAAARQDANDTVAAALEVAADTAERDADDDDTVEAAIDGLEGAEAAARRDEDDVGTEDEVGVAHDDEPLHADDEDAATLASALAAAGDVGDDGDADGEIDRELLQAAASGDMAAVAADSRYRLWDEDPSLVETIVMEGDMITDTLSEADADDADEHQPAADAGLELAAAELAAGGGQERASAMTPRQRYLGIAAIVLLGLLLAGQVVHANRESLATLGLFDRTLAPLYEAFGAPVTPAWNVRGWQFESTSGSTDESGSRLTIYSRIANRAAESLPYPLVHVSLTDRFDEVIGSRLLAPDEYLAGNGSIDRPVAAGDDFTAVITLDAPSPDATGFKLNVCYPVAGRRVRCAIEDFRD